MDGGNAIITFNFERALEMLKREDNPKVTRTGWNGKDMCLQMQHPDDNSKMGLPYIYIKTVEGKLVPWVASQTDLLATDWTAVYQEGVSPAAPEVAEAPAADQAAPEATPAA